MLVYIYGEFCLRKLNTWGGEAWDRESTERRFRDYPSDESEQWLEANAPTENDRYTNRELMGELGAWSLLSIVKRCY